MARIICKTVTKSVPFIAGDKAINAHGKSAVPTRDSTYHKDARIRAQSRGLVAVGTILRQYGRKTWYHYPCASRARAEGLQYSICSRQPLNQSGIQSCSGCIWNRGVCSSSMWDKSHRTGNIMSGRSCGWQKQSFVRVVVSRRRDSEEELTL